MGALIGLPLIRNLNKTWFLLYIYVHIWAYLGRTQFAAGVRYTKNGFYFSKKPRKRETYIPLTINRFLVTEVFLLKYPLIFMRRT